MRPFNASETDIAEDHNLTFSNVPIIWAYGQINGVNGTNNSYTGGKNGAGALDLTVFKQAE